MSELDYLLSPQAVRDGAKKIFDATALGRTSFVLNESKLAWTIDYVLETIRQKYPDLNIPFHSRWGHFRPGGVDRTKWLDEKIAAADPMERARIKLDLVITSVLLDAGAGAEWKFYEQATGQTIARSEGLGVASYHMFMSGAFASDGTSLRADQEGLASLSAQKLADGFQVSASNPLVGVEGRVRLLNNLGAVVKNQTIFPGGRPGSILDYLVGRYGKTIPAAGLLRAVLDGLGPIWPGRLTHLGTNLGDVWLHSTLGMIPFHKLSQWMTYSLIEPIEEAGITVAGVEGLTGLAEYRNGGLILDSGLVGLKNIADIHRVWRPDSDLIVEWRGLTVYYLDLIGAGVQQALGKTAAEFPLAKVLEGGTWWAGRRIAAEKRRGGGPPLHIDSDGTVF